MKSKIKLSDYCTIKRSGEAFIDIDTGWKFWCDLHGMDADYAQLFIRRLARKRRLNDEDTLLDAEVTVPDIQTQRFIVGAIKTLDQIWIETGDVMKAYREMQQLTGDPYFDEMRKYYNNYFGELNDHRFLLIDQLMGV